MLFYFVYFSFSFHLQLISPITKPNQEKEMEPRKEESSLENNNNNKDLIINVNEQSQLSPGKGQLDPEVIGFRATSESYPMSDVFVVDNWFPLGMRSPKLPLTIPRNIFCYFGRFAGVARFRFLKPRDKKFIPPGFVSSHFIRNS
jgi:hypothetical protein